MFSPPRGGNLHPSVLNKSSALGHGALPPSLVPGANSGLESRGVPSAAAGASIDIDEAEARMRAREILQDFVRQKNKSHDVEQQLQRALQENERLSHAVDEQRVQLQLEKERHMREMANLKADRGDTETRIQLANDEIQRVAKAAAQRAADSAAHLRVKEQEIESLEAELVAAREEIYRLRTELLKLRENAQATDEVAEAQQKVVELARKLLQSEKAKTQLEHEILADRKHHQQALLTIESLRKQAADSDSKVAVVEAQSQKERVEFQRSLEGVHREMEMQREMYKSFMEQLSLGRAGATAGSITATAGSSSAAANSGSLSIEVSVLQTRLHAAQEANELLQRQLNAVSAELEESNRSVFAERTKRIDEIGALRIELQRQEAMRDEDARRTAEAVSAAAREHDQLVQLIGVHEQTKKDLETQLGNFGRAQQQLRELVKVQEHLKTELAALREEAKVRESAVSQLTEALRTRTNNEARIRELQILHNHEKELLRLQLAKGGGGGASALAQVAAAAAAALPTEEIEKLNHKITMLEAERDRLVAERSTILQTTDAEKAALVLELRSAKEALENTRIENAQLRSHALHAQREVEEWRSAFHMAERAKHKIQQQLEDTRDLASASLQDRNSGEARMQLLTQHVNRLEAQAERDMQELFRVRRDLANAEVALARREVDIKNDELNRIMALRPENAAAQLEKEKELMRLRAEKDRREKDLQQRELTAQQIHEGQLRTLSQSALAARGGAYSPSGVVAASPSPITLDAQGYHSLMAVASAATPS